MTDYNDLLATILFLKHHPTVNGMLLDSAISKTLRNRTDCSFDIPNPMEVKPFLDLDIDCTTVH